MPRLWGAKPDEPETPPIIELVGPIDCGKRAIGELVASRIGGVFISLPVLNPLRPVGKALFTGLVQTPQALELQPGWWCHLYAAQLYEMTEEITKVLDSGRPVIVTNYLISFRIWAAALGIDSLKGWTKDLVEPRLAYGVVGEPCPTNGNVPHAFSEGFIDRVNKRLRHPYDRRVIHLQISETEQWHTAINSVAEKITENLHLKYGVEINKKHLYPKNHFPKRIFNDTSLHPFM